MPADAVLLTVYALLLLATAHGLRALGHRSTSPYASRPLAGHVRATGETPDVGMDSWPHNEVPRLYAGMSLTAALAAIALSVAGLVLHHEAVSVVALLAVVTLSALTVVRLARALGDIRPRTPGGAGASATQRTSATAERREPVV